MKFIPLFYRINQQACLIVGGGRIAMNRATAFANAGAVIDVISPQCLPSLLELIEASGGAYFNSDFTHELIDKDYYCIVAATDSAPVNNEVHRVAKSKNIPVNVAHNQAQCDFIFPATLERSPITIAVSNNGASPVLSRLLRQQIDMFLPNAYGELSQFVGLNREKVKQAIADEKVRVSFWEHVIQGAIAEAIFSSKQDDAQRLLDAALRSPEAFNNTGEVYLIGAGPGDPDLLTLRAFRLLQQADVVLYDNLVSEEVIALIKPGTELIYVGKRRDNHAVPQEGINSLLVSHAKQGKRVARLKGGDPFVFGRGGEEIESLVDEQIPFQVVPGITAANGCSAYAGIPLTHRDYAQSIQFVTGQLKDGSINLNWKELVSPGKTLVFYMGLRGLPIICDELIANGMSSTMPVALIEKGTTRSQRVLVSTLGEMPQILQQENVASPSLFIVGQVVSLVNKLEWFQAK